MAAWRQGVEDVVASTLVLARARPGRLAALTIALPESLAREPIVALLRARLRACGHADVEILTRPTLGELRLSSAEFER